MKKAVEILERLRELLYNPDRWCQKMSAMDVNGKRTFGSEPEAVKWCMVGGIAKVSVDAKGITSDTWRAAYDRLESIAGNIGKFNDTHTHPEVIQLIDSAIELEKSTCRNLES